MKLEAIARSELLDGVERSIGCLAAHDPEHLCKFAVPLPYTSEWLDPVDEGHLEDAGSRRSPCRFATLPCRVSGATNRSTLATGQAR